jgi:hypothetical protein
VACSRLPAPLGSPWARSLLPPGQYSHHIELRIVDAGVAVLNAVEDESAAAVLDEVRKAATSFMIAPAGGEVAG